MNKSQLQKSNLFKIFSRNFEYVNEKNGQVKFTPYMANSYMCPICFGGFLEKDLTSNQESYLTIEHVPPVALGGKGAILTCNKCNSESGKTFDKELNKLMETLDFTEFLPKVKHSTPMTFNGHSVNTRFLVDEGGMVNLHLDIDRSNPAMIKNVINEIESESVGSKIKNGVSGTIPLKKQDSRLVDLALLRIGYLSMISQFGYSALINQGMLYVREQILNPEKKILERPYNAIMELPMGISIIKSPKELQCFIVVFVLKTKSASRTFNVMLPGPTGVGIDIYKNFKHLVTSEQYNKHVPMMLEHLPIKRYVSDLNLAFGYHYYWQTHTK